MYEHFPAWKRVALVVAMVYALAATLAIIGPSLVRGATANATVTWTIPTDTTISISYPTGRSDINFAPSSGTTAQLKATSQTDSVAAVRITNNGNVPVTLSAAFTTSLGSGIAEFRIANVSSSDAPSDGQIWWCGAESDSGMSPPGGCSGTDNSTTSRTIRGSSQKLAVGSSHDLWAWTWTVNASPGTTTRTWQVTSGS